MAQSTVDVWLQPLDCADPGFISSVRAHKHQLELQLLSLGCGDVCGTVLDAALQAACEFQPRPVLLAALTLLWFGCITLLVRGLAIKFVR